VKIGILETGYPPETLRGEFGSYPQMFTQLLGEAGLGAQITSLDVQKGDFPETPEAFDAYLITGSSAGVYDPLPWIEPLKDFLRASKGRAKLVGVCFGHQIMAETFGGKTIKSPKGWGVGLHSYAIETREPWTDAVASVAIPASHQDQVVELPPGAQVVAASAFTPFAMLAYGDQPAISMQPHPEFDPVYAAALIKRRYDAEIFTERQAEAAIETLGAPNDNRRVGGWIKRFLEG
jgi:GMP synthase-like glutamine amidotransferase